MTDRSVSVLGAGIVGICSAIELQRSGFQVELIDRGQPGSETSSGNAGILSLGSIAPLASPALLSRLPGLLANRYADFRLHYAHLPQLMPWLLRFLARCNRNTYFCDGAMINALTVASVEAHRQLMRDTRSEHLALNSGSLFVYRQQKSYEQNELLRELFRRCQVEFSLLERADIKALEPDLNDCFVKGMWVKNSISLKDPRELCQCYARYFRSLGGVIKQQEVTGIEWVDNSWTLISNQQSQKASRLVLCLGAWTPNLLKPLGYRNVIAIERGYHMMFAAQDGRQLSRPVFDAEGCYAMVPMSGGIRMSTGSNLIYRETEATAQQIDQVEPRAREAFPLGERLLETPWMGRRPSTPDSLPIIGAAPGQQNLWLAYGHAHMGLTMGPITGQIIASQIAGEKPPLDSPAFAPERYLRAPV